MAQTDAKSAKLLTNDVDHPANQEFITDKQRSPETVF